MVWLGPSHRRAISRIVVAVLSGLLLSWLAVAALIALSLAWPRNPVPRALLAVWAVLAVVSLAIPGAFRGKISASLLIFFLAAPFMPFVRAAVAVWPHLPEAIRDFLEGNFRSRRRARLHRTHAR
jgi:hypothetical protein